MKRNNNLVSSDYIIHSMSPNLTAPTYSVTPYFINQRNVISLLNPVQARNYALFIERINQRDAWMKEVLTERELVANCLSIIRDREISPIEEMLFSNSVEAGRLVTMHRSLYFRGAAAALKKQQEGQKSYADFHGKLSEFDEILIEGKFSPEHFTCSSSTDRLSGRGTMFLLGLIDEVKEGSIQIRPIIIGDRVYGDTADIFTQNVFHILPEDIDEFSKMAPHNAQKWDINRLRDVSEQTCKKWLAEILNEGNVPKDWGGETSDLFTNHVHVKGERLSAAFLLKGPAKFHPLTLTDLGKNGDQIVRLFREPAQVYFVQHCNYITPAIIHVLDAFASRLNSLSRYCTLDGIDTLRILVGYGYL